METTQTDRIEQQVFLRAPRSRVWKALTDAEAFGTWFGVKLEGRFVPGAWVKGPVTNPGYEHIIMEVLVETLEPEVLFSFRWHPYAIDPGTDYSSEPTTLVAFRLEDVEEGTLLVLVESGFDQIPAARREKAYRMNDGGWTQQMASILRYVQG